MKQLHAKRWAKVQTGHLIRQYQDAGQPFADCIDGRLEGHRRTSVADTLACPDCRTIAAELTRLRTRFE